MTLTPHDLFQRLPHFYTNTTIQRLGEYRAWSVSDLNKMPVNIPELLRTGAIYGASMYKLDEHAVTLPELTQHLPDAANCAFYLNAPQHGVVILDIEKTCPIPLRNKLLTLLHHALYAETSMSGRGYHLVLPAGAQLLLRDEVVNASKLQHPEKYYEVLVHHWITFTRNPIPDGIIAEAQDYAQQHGALTVTQMLDDLHADRRAALSMSSIKHQDLSHITTDIIEPDDYTNLQRAADAEIIDAVCDTFDERYNREPSDFNYDLSRWEYSVINTALYWCKKKLSSHINAWNHIRYHNDHADDDDQMQVPYYYDTEDVPILHLIRLTYGVVQQRLPHRVKHEGFRNGLPYLLSQCVRAAEGLDTDD